MAMFYCFGPFGLDADAKILFRGSEPTALGQRAVMLLQLLLERAGTPVSKDALIEAAWPKVAIEDSNLTVQIATLRRVLEDAAQGASWIETLPRRGYRYIGPAVEIRDRPIAAAPVVQSAGTLPDKPSVAVLPFENMSGDLEQSHFADGLTADIITALSLWRSFPVIARNSTFVYKRRSADIKEVGRMLGARYILEGSVRRSGSRVRVAAQLIDTETGHHVWGERFERRLADLFDLQDELTRKIAAVVVPELERAEYRRLSAKRPQNLDAWYYVQRGTAELDEYTRAGNIRARDMFSRAIELDPHYARAVANLALTYNRDLLLGYAQPDGDAADRALKHARRAIELDRSDFFAHSVLAMANIWAGDLEQAKLHFQRSVELNPSHGYGLASLGNILDLMGNPERGIPMMEEGLCLNPDAPNMRHIYTFLARGLIAARRCAEAIEWARRGIAADPQNAQAQYLLAVASAHLGQIEQARAILNQCEYIQPGFVAGRANWRPYNDSRDGYILDGIRKLQ